MQVPEKVYLVIETKPDGTEDTDGIEFHSIEEASNHAIDLVAKATAEKRYGYTYTIDTVTWLHEI